SRGLPAGQGSDYRRGAQGHPRQGGGARMNPSPRCVLFDLDGTLIDTYRLYMESFRSTLEPHFKRRLSDADLLALDPYAEQRLLLNVIPETEFNEYFELFLTQYARFHEPLFGGVYDGVVEMLKALEAG